MPPSKPPYLTLSLSLFASALLLLWFNQDSLETYWQQQYHRPSPLAGLRQYSPWQLGSRWREALFGGGQNSDDSISAPPQPYSADNGRETPAAAAPALENHTDASADTHSSALPPDTPPPSAENSSDAAAPPVLSDDSFPPSPPNPEHSNDAAPPVLTSIPGDNPLPLSEAAPIGLPDDILPPPPANLQNSSNAAAPPVLTSIPGDNPLPLSETASPVLPDDSLPPPPLDQHILLRRGDEVLFIGDSMMQSFAPHMQKWLQNQHGIRSFNLARHSTGLSNQAYYDWPQKAARRFADSPQLKLVVVMMGANDPWNIETADKRLLAFKSPEWAQEYSARALHIVSAAKAQGAQVIWIGLPPMRLGKYDAKIRYLDDTLAAELAGQALYIRSRPLLDGGSGSYQDSIEHQGKRLRVRHKDGIHLNSAGEALLLEAVKTHLHFATPAE